MAAARRTRGDPAPAVLVVMNGADDTLGGSLRAAISTAEAMQLRGIHVTFTAPIPRSGAPTRMIDTAGADLQVRLFAARGPAYRFGASLRHFIWLLRTIRSFDAVHIHSTFYGAALYTALLCRIFKVPLFIWPHGSLHEYDVRKHYRAKRILGAVLFRPMLNASTGVLCTTDREARELVTFGAKVTTHVVSLPVEAPPETAVDRSAWRREHALDPDSYVMLSLGRVDPKKRLDRAIDALALLADENVSLAIVGATDSEELSSIRRRALERGVSDRVAFIGWLDGTDRLAAFAAADCFVLASDNENFGLAVVEAMLTHLPVVISEEVYISEELLAAGAALVPERDPEAIAGAIRQLIADPAAARLMAQRGFEFASERYAADTVGRRIAEACGLGDAAG